VSLVRAAWRWLADHPHQRIGLRIMQVLLGCALLFKAIVYWPLADALWGPNGVAAGQSYIGLFGARAGGVLDTVFRTSAGTHAVLVAIGLGALGLVAGRTFFASVSLALAGFSLLLWRLPFSQGDDDLTRFALVYMLFTVPPCAQVRPGTLRVWFHNIGVLAIAAQVVILYFVAGFAKAFGEQWQHGTALYYGSQSALFSSPLFQHITQSPWIVAPGTYISVVYPIMFPVAILSPFRVPWLVWGMLFHFLTAILMGLWAFGTLMIGMDLFLITDREYATLRQWVRARVRGAVPAPAVRLYIDGFCPTCRATAHVLANLNWLGRVDIVSFRDPAIPVPPGVTPARFEAEMVLVDLRRGRAIGGFQAIRALARQIPLLWLAQPLLAVIAWSGWGNRVYRYLAENRRVIPDPRACRVDACEVHGDGRPRSADGAVSTSASRRAVGG
jgi:predicted DCC family thiol-disulfide oxidoreductase YuxK